MAQAAIAIIVILFAVLLALSIDSLAGWLLTIAVGGAIVILAFLILKGGGKQ